MIDWADLRNLLHFPDFGNGKLDSEVSLTTAMPSLEIHVPISPTAQFFNMVHLLAISLRINGGEMADTPIIVTVGEDCEPFDLHSAQPWSRRYPIQWMWMNRNRYKERIYFATAVERFCHDFKSEVVLLLDADMIVTRPFGELVRQVAAEDFFGGVIAHVSPFMMFNQQFPAQARPNQDWWDALLCQAGLAKTSRTAHEHTGWNFMFSDPSYRYCPPYFNLGFLIAPAARMHRIGEVIYTALDHVDNTLDTFYKCQLAVTLALGLQCTPFKSLAVRYNFPNIDAFRKAYPDDYAGMAILHYLARGKFDKDRNLHSPTTLEQWLKMRWLTKSDKMLQQELRKLHGSFSIDHLS